MKKPTEIAIIEIKNWFFLGFQEEKATEISIFEVKNWFFQVLRVKNAEIRYKPCF